MMNDVWVVIPLPDRGYLLGQIVKRADDAALIKVLPEGVVNARSNWWGEATGYNYMAQWVALVVPVDELFLPERFVESPAYPDALAAARWNNRQVPHEAIWPEAGGPPDLPYWLALLSRTDDPPDSVRMRHLCGFEALIPIAEIVKPE